MQILRNIHITKIVVLLLIVLRLNDNIMPFCFSVEEDPIIGRMMIYSQMEGMLWSERDNSSLIES